MISNRCARKSLVINCNLIVSENYSRFLVDSNEKEHKMSPIKPQSEGIIGLIFIASTKATDIRL